MEQPLTTLSFLKSAEWQLILNPNAYSKKCLRNTENVINQLVDIQISFQEYVTRDCRHCQELLTHLCQIGKRHFMVVGGDGTLNEVINILFAAGVPTEELFILPIPSGTGNDWCRTHQYPPLSELVNKLDDGRFIRHDIGLVKSIANGAVHSRYFVNIAGFAFDATVIKTILEKKTKYFKSATYLANLLKVLLTYKAQKVKIMLPDTTLEKNVFTIAVGLCQYNGNGMQQVPMGDPTDGQFDVVVIDKISTAKVIKNVKNLYGGQHITLPEVHVYKTDRLSISSTEKVLGEVEGEMLTQGDYEITLLPKAIRLFTFEKEHFAE